MPYLNQLDCCGAVEAAEIREHSDPVDNLKETYENWCGFYQLEKTINGPALIFFSVKQSDLATGNALFQLIKKENLGPIFKGPITRNPNSENKIRGYFWTVRPLKFHAWAMRTDPKWAKDTQMNAKESADYDW